MLSLDVNSLSPRRVCPRAVAPNWRALAKRADRAWLATGLVYSAVEAKYQIRPERGACACPTVAARRRNNRSVNPGWNVLVPVCASFVKSGIPRFFFNSRRNRGSAITPAASKVTTRWTYSGGGRRAVKCDTAVFFSCHRGGGGVGWRCDVAVAGSLAPHHGPAGSGRAGTLFKDRQRVCTDANGRRKVNT